MRLLPALLALAVAAPVPTLEGAPLAVRWMTPAKLVGLIPTDDAGPARQLRVTTAHVRATIARGTLVRAVFPKSACYLAGFSNTLTS